MVIVCRYSGEQFHYAMEGGISPVETIAAGHWLEHLAEDLYQGLLAGEPAPAGQGRSGTFQVAVAGGEVEVSAEPGDVIVVVSWERRGSAMQGEYLLGAAPSWEQVKALAAFLDEHGRHHYRSVLANDQIQRAQRMAAITSRERAAIEKVAGRVGRA